MKKLLVTAAIALTACFAQAQNNVEFGIKGGMNLSNFILDDEMSTDSRVGFHVGFLTDIKVSNLISIQPEFLLSRKGAQDKRMVEFNQLKLGYKLTCDAYYLEIPVNMKFNFPINGNNVYVGYGPYFGFGLFGKERTEAIGSINDKEFIKEYIYEEEFFESGYTHRFDFGVGIQTGFEHKSGLLIGMGLSYGFLKVFDTDLDSKNLNFSVSMGYKF